MTRNSSDRTDAQPSPVAPTADRICIANSIGSTFIIAFREDTTRLEQTLTHEGLPWSLLRQEAHPENEGVSSSILCLLNHYRAWEQVARSTHLALIVEADFVPVRQFGKLPLPGDRQQLDLGILWLYTCAPQLYSVNHQGYAEGFSTSMVAYILTPRGAQHLLDLAHTFLDGSNHYSTWDSQVDGFLRRRGCKNYIPFRNYGEHGGRPNPEHRLHGLSTTHRADVLYGRLAFRPIYASQGWQGMGVRLRSRLKGLGRLLLGKFLRPKILRRSSTPLRLLRFAIARHLTLHL